MNTWRSFLFRGNGIGGRGQEIYTQRERHTTEHMKLPRQKFRDCQFDEGGVDFTGQMADP